MYSTNIETPLLTTVETKAMSGSLTVRTLKRAARISGDVCPSWDSIAAGPNRTTRSACRTAWSSQNRMSEGTSLENTIAPEIPFQWGSVTLRVEKAVSTTQRHNLRAGVAIVDRHDIRDTKYTDGIVVKARYDLGPKMPEALPKLERRERISVQKRELPYRRGK